MGHTKIFGAVGDLKALTVEEIVGLSAVLLACRDAHLPPEFPVLQSG